jgi:hypothetical protein
MSGAKLKESNVRDRKEIMESVEKSLKGFGVTINRDTRRRGNRRELIVSAVADCNYIRSTKGKASQARRICN